MYPFTVQSYLCGISSVFKTYLWHMRHVDMKSVLFETWLLYMMYKHFIIKFLYIVFTWDIKRKDG